MRAGRWRRVGKGDTVCLMMPDRPEFLAMWLGITRVGGVVALLNTNLTGMALAHCINVVEPKHIIVAAELLDALAGRAHHVTGEPKIWLHGEPTAQPSSAHRPRGRQARRRPVRGR